MQLLEISTGMEWKTKHFAWMLKVGENSKTFALLSFLYETILIR